MKNILILSGSPRKNGKTASLVKAFAEGAESAGNEVKELYLQGMNIGGCLACEGCQRNGGTCVQKDDMQIVTEAFLWSRKCTSGYYRFGDSAVRNRYENNISDRRYNGRW